nr:MAG TPA: hypothetical protein [Caudoviricetes sp.]
MPNNLIKSMKESIAAAGASKRDIVYFKPDDAIRVRFLTELDSGVTATMHNQFSQDGNGIFAICEDPEDHEACKYCKDEVPLQEWYAWAVWDYDSAAVRLIFQKATGVSPVPSLIEMYENYGTILDRDYKIKKVGKGKSSSFVITPLDKSAFKNKKAKALTEDKIRELIEKAYSPVESSDDEEEEEETKKSKSKAKGKKKERSLRDKYDELDFSDVKEIAKELGMSKKELKEFEDSEELVEELFDNYEEEDLQDLYDDLESGDDDDE